MAKYIIKREYTTEVFVNGEKTTSVTVCNKTPVTGSMKDVAENMMSAQTAYIDNLRIKDVAFGEQRYNSDDVVSLGCAFSAIHHRLTDCTISFFLSQFSERVSD